MQKRKCSSFCFKTSGDTEHVGILHFTVCRIAQRNTPNIVGEIIYDTKLQPSSQNMYTFVLWGIRRSSQNNQDQTKLSISGSWHSEKRSEEPITELMAETLIGWRVTVLLNSQFYRVNWNSFKFNKLSFYATLNIPALCQTENFSYFLIFLAPIFPTKIGKNTLRFHFEETSNTPLTYGLSLREG